MQSLIGGNIIRYEDNNDDVIIDCKQLCKYQKKSQEKTNAKTKKAALGVLGLLAIGFGVACFGTAIIGMLAAKTTFAAVSFITGMISIATGKLILPPWIKK